MRSQKVCSSAEQSASLSTGALGREILDLLQKHFVDPTLLQRWKESGSADALNDISVAEEGVRDRMINAALEKLEISHTRRFTPNEVGYFHLLDAYAPTGIGKLLKNFFPRGVRYTGIGVLSANLEGTYFVSAVLPGSPAAQAGIQRGDELIAVDNRPFTPVKAFAGLDGQVVSLRCRKQRELPSKKVCVRPQTLVPRALLRRASISGARILSGTRRMIAYYKPWSLAGDSHWRILTSTLSGRLRDADTLILDLRHAVGGASPDYAEFFVGRSPELCLTRPGQAVTFVNPHWQKPVVLIVDETTRSGNEVLTFAIQRAGYPVIGQRTAGEVTVAKPFLLADGSLLLVATKRVMVDGVVLEGCGVMPDVEVISPLPFAQGADPQFEAAIALADA